MSAAPRITLRPASPADAPLVEPWLGEAVAAVAGVAGGSTAMAGKRPSPPAPLALPDYLAAQGEMIEARLISVEGQPRGLLLWEPLRCTGCNPPPETPVIRALALAKGERNLGYGMEAVVLLEQLTGAPTLYAAVPRANGLAVYFWLRAGYRPVRLDECALMARDAALLWMVSAVDRDAGPAADPPA